MAKFNKGDKVVYVTPASGGGKFAKSYNRQQKTGECISTKQSGVYVKNSDGEKEFIHRNRIDN